MNVRVEPQFKNFMASFYTEASAGLLIDWTKKRMTQNREVVLRDLLAIFKISIPPCSTV